MMRSKKSLLRPTWTQRRDAALHASLGDMLNGQPYALFLVCEKDDPIDPEPFMPNGFNECHGFCLLGSGGVYSFGFRWSGDRPAITEWEACAPKDQPWARTPAYRKAREQMGIGMALFKVERKRRARRFVRVRRGKTPA